MLRGVSGVRRSVAGWWDRLAAVVPGRPDRFGGGVPARVDLVVAGCAVLVVMGGSLFAARLQVEARGLDAGAVALIVVAGSGLGWRRRAPVMVLAVVVGAVATYLGMGYPYGPMQLCMVVAMFEVARLRGSRTSLAWCATAVAVITVALLTRRGQDSDEPLLLATAFASWLVVPWSVGALVQVRAAATRRTRRELIARGALEERMRVAQEVHDVAGHGFSAVAMQAGVALVVFDEQPAQARESIEAIRATSTQALTDLRQLLDAFEHRPEGLAELSTLVSGIRAAGVSVQLSVTATAVPDDIGRVAYRVVQEALTNVLRHAGQATADVRVEAGESALLVEVEDDGAGSAEGGAGRGLRGMRARVEAAGGTLETTSAPGRGFRVTARLPLAGGRA